MSLMIESSFSAESYAADGTITPVKTLHKKTAGGKDR